MKRTNRHLNCDDDFNIVMDCVRLDGKMLEHASDRLKNNKKIVMAAVEDNGSSLNYASPKLQEDTEVILTAIKQQSWCFYHASIKLRGDYKKALKFLEIAVKENKDNVKISTFFTDKLKGNYDFAMDALDIHPNYVQFVSSELKDNYNVIMKAITKRGYNIEHASIRLKKNRILVEKALEHYVEAIRYATWKPSSDSYIILDGLMSRVTFLYDEELRSQVLKWFNINRYFNIEYLELLNNYVDPRISKTANFIYAVNPDIFFIYQDDRKRKFE